MIKKVNNEVQKEFYFYNNNIVLPYSMVKIARYTIKDIADILNISYQEVFNQLNTMIKESGYKLFN